MRGFAQPSRPGLLGAVLVAFSVILIGALLLTEKRVASSRPRAWMMDPTDDYGRLTQMVLRGADALGTQANVWILGASDTREMLMTEAELNHRVEQFPGGTRVVTLCADGLLLEERAAIIDRLRPRTAGAIVLGINLGQFCRPAADLEGVAERYRLGFRSVVFDEEAGRIGARMPPATGHFSYDNRMFFLRRLARMVRLGPPPEYQDHRSQARAGMRVDPWPFRRMRRFSSEEFDRRAGLISRLAARNRQAGGPPVVLLEIPTMDYVDPGISGPNRTAELGVYRAAVRRLAEREGLHYLDPAATVPLRRDDFADFAHIGDDGARARFSEEFLRQLRPILEGRKP